MSDSMNLNVRISGSLKNFVSHEIKQGSYENISEYVRDLIRQDKANNEKLAFEHLKAELKLTFAAPDNEYIELSAEQIFNNEFNDK